ncbi:TraR/DksA C4-type zinc finger protein [bacterium]|nr:TraR/DksA C4-type zinc finger protein [bacterium]MCI0680338.1 TraR/DksA C4-type zinc finger protein [bacterium]
MANNINIFKQRLLEEKAVLENELKTVGRKNPSNPADWEPTPGEIDVLRSDKNEAADAIEQYEERAAITAELENRYNNILDALKKIDENTFGICEICGGEIEEERLKANPSAKTCKKHLDAE